MITISVMSQKDIPAASALYIEVFNNNLPIPETWSIQTATSRLNETFTKKFSFVAKENNRMIGVLISYISTFDKGPFLDIDTLIVKKEYRQKGIGRQLFMKALDVAKKNNITSIHLLAHTHLESFQWYENLGFKKSGWVELIKTLV